MRLAAFSLGDTAKASSRLRSFYLFQYAHDFDIEVLRDIAYNKALNCNIVHIQKVLSYQLLFWMPIWRLFHVKVIYDLDDQPGTFRARLGFILAIFFENIYSNSVMLFMASSILAMTFYMLFQVYLIQQYSFDNDIRHLTNKIK